MSSENKVTQKACTGDEADSVIPALLGDSPETTPDHVRDVAHAKRFLERWTMDPSYRDTYTNDPQAALASLGIELRPYQLDPLIDHDLATRTTLELEAGNADACPLAVSRYRAFVAEKQAHRVCIRTAGQPTEPRLAAWRQRQVNRSAGELGTARAEAIVHAPMAIELSEGVHGRLLVLRCGGTAVRSQLALHAAERQAVG